MLIIVPSYKRTDILSLVIKSIIRSDVRGIEERKLILVVNNYPENTEIVENIIGKCELCDGFECIALHRKVTIAAVDSWYSAMNEVALEGEVVFLLGDDDLMLPWGIRDRYFEISRNAADMLISDFLDRIFFFDRGRKYLLSAKLPKIEDRKNLAQRWDFFPAKHPEASFISNHCYRNTPAFRKGLALAFIWCNSQNWLDRPVRTGMLPFYLAYAVMLSGGEVFALHSKCVLRGAIAEEAMRSNYSDGGNQSFYHLLAYNIFSNRDLPHYQERLSKVCGRFKPGIFSGFISMLVDKNISFKDLMTTLKKSNIGVADIFCVDLIRSAGAVLIQIFGLRGVRLKLLSRSRFLNPIEDIFLSKKITHSQQDK